MAASTKSPERADGSFRHQQDHHHHHRHAWLFPVMILFSMFLHALSFYLVQVANPQMHAARIARARLSILNHQSAADRQLLAWIENHDPADLGRHAEVVDPPPALIQVTFEPEFTKSQPQLLPVPEQPTGSRFPPIPQPVEKLFTNPRRPPLPLSTRGTLLPTGIRFIPQLNFSASPDQSFAPPTSNILPSPSRFFIQIADGRLKEAFLQNSSGDEGLDKYALGWLQKGHFEAVESSENTWNEAIFSWGGDVADGGGK